MPDNTINNKRIAKNTMILYVRMIIMTLISLYTARIVLSTLGFENYGIYQVVGGVVVLFSFLNNGLSSASNRYITAEIAKNDTDSGQKTFNVCLQAHLLIALVVLIIAETVGLWIVNNILEIPEGKTFAANVVYQFSVITAIISIVSTPFNATIIAYERMNIYAYIAIFDAFMKLAIVFLIQIFSGDKLICYAFLLLAVSIVHIIINYIYCHRSFLICRLKKVKDTPLLKSIFKFTSWSLLGQSCIVGTNQGVTLLLNYFCGVTVNAAMGISNQILNIVNQFVGNFQTAFRPQIIKSYVSNNIEYLQSLIMRSSKLTSCLMLIFIIPILLQIEHILNLWLGAYPEYTIEFVRWTLIALFFDSLTGPLWMTIGAQTDIKKYQIWTSLFFSMNFFIGWIILLLDIFPPYYVVIVRVFVFIILIAVRLYFTKKFFIQFKVNEWITDVLLKSTLVLAISFFGVHYALQSINVAVWQEIILAVLLSELLVCSLSYSFLLSRAERNFIKKIINKILRR